MQHQDWSTVVFSTPSKPVRQAPLNSAKNSKTHTQHRPQLSEEAKKIISLENETENLKHIKVSQELKIAIMQARTSKNMKRSDVAKLLNTNEKQIADYENGKIIPNNQFIARLEKALGTKLPRVKNT